MRDNNKEDRPTTVRNRPELIEKERKGAKFNYHEKIIIRDNYENLFLEAPSPPSRSSSASSFGVINSHQEQTSGKRTTKASENEIRRQSERFVSSVSTVASIKKSAPAIEREPTIVCFN